jgi:hypothetical protein
MGDVFHRGRYMHAMIAKALVVVSALVAFAGAADATATDAAAVPGRTSAPTLARERTGRAVDAAATQSRKGGAGHVQDDYAAALALARRRHVPIVVDVWAPW